MVGSVIVNYKISGTYFVREPVLNEMHERIVQPDLDWVSDNNRTEISRLITTWAERLWWLACSISRRWDETLISQIRDFDFRSLRPEYLNEAWGNFVNKLWTMVRYIVAAIMYHALRLMVLHSWSPRTLRVVSFVRHLGMRLIFDFWRT